jgi:hypothetical protein
MGADETCGASDENVSCAVSLWPDSSFQGSYEGVDAPILTISGTER